MKKWISLVTCVACAFSSMTYADAAPPATLIQEQAEEPIQEQVQLAASPELADEPETTPDMNRKQVGAAADEGSKAGSGAGKYVLAACAIIVAVVALILVARHDGHHHKHGHH